MLFGSRLCDCSLRTAGELCASGGAAVRANSFIGGRSSNLRFWNHFYSFLVSFLSNGVALITHSNPVYFRACFLGEVFINTGRRGFVLIVKFLESCGTRMSITLLNKGGVYIAIYAHLFLPIFTSIWLAHSGTCRGVGLPCISSPSSSSSVTFRASSWASLQGDDRETCNSLSIVDSVISLIRLI